MNKGNWHPAFLMALRDHLLVVHAHVAANRIILAAFLALLIVAKLCAYILLLRLPLGQAMCQWDCGWYVSVIERGYDLAPRFVANCCWQANWAFFPLMPMLVAGLRAVFGGKTLLLGVLVASVCLFAFALLGARLREKTRGETQPLPWLFFLLCWPFSFYFHTIYTEALFAALAAAVLLALRESRPWVAALACAGLTATRPTGILLAAWIGIRQLWLAWQCRTWRHALVTLAPAAIAPLGLLVFMTFLHVKVGDPLAFHHIQAEWGRRGGNPLAVLLRPFLNALRGQPDYEALYFAAWALLGGGATLWLAVRRRFAEAWLCGMPIILALASGALISMPRFVSTNPAFILAVADWFFMVRSRALRGAILLSMLALQVWLLFAWLKGPRFLM